MFFSPAIIDYFVNVSVALAGLPLQEDQLRAGLDSRNYCQDYDEEKANQ